MTWKDIRKINNPKAKYGYALDIVDVLICIEHNKPVKCKGCPYVLKCNQYESKHSDLLNSLMANCN